MIIDVIREISVSAVENSLGADIILGKVLSTAPLKIKIDNNITLESKNVLQLTSSTASITAGNSVAILTLKNKFLILGGVDN